MCSVARERPRDCSEIDEDFVPGSAISRNTTFTMASFDARPKLSKGVLASADVAEGRMLDLAELAKMDESKASALFLFELRKYRNEHVDGALTKTGGKRGKDRALQRSISADNFGVMGDIRRAAARGKPDMYGMEIFEKTKVKEGLKPSRKEERGRERIKKGIAVSPQQGPHERVASFAIGDRREKNSGSSNTRAPLSTTASRPLYRMDSEDEQGCSPRVLTMLEPVNPLERLRGKTGAGRKALATASIIRRLNLLSVSRASDNPEDGS